jgi:predicted ATP-grasp superfamily ATP-dependent carboligase
LDKSNEWFIEDRVDGKSCSIQCLKHAASDEVTIFGFSEQTIVDDSIFIGSKLRSPNDMESLENQFFELIRRIHPVLERYEGFFGIDFVLMDDNTVSASEINVRLTAATVPTLMLNALGKSSAIYLEDVSLNEVSDGDIKLAIDEKAKAADILRIEK